MADEREGGQVAPNDPVPPVPGASDGPDITYDAPVAEAPRPATAAVEAPDGADRPDAAADTPATAADDAVAAAVDAGAPPAPSDAGADERPDGGAGHADDDVAGSGRARGDEVPQGDGAAAAMPPGAEVAADAPAGDPGAAQDDVTPPLRKVLEAILLVVDEPVPAVDLAQVLEHPRVAVETALDDLAAEYAAADRGFELRQVAGGWRLYTAPDCAAYVERFVLDGQQARLTQAALETLAVIAYRQPVSRQSVAAIRGVNVDGVVRTLLGRGLIAEAGQEGPGGAHLYVTTPYFLERLGLRSLDELPNLAPLLPTNLDDFADQA